MPRCECHKDSADPSQKKLTDRSRKCLADPNIEDWGLGLRALSCGSWAWGLITGDQGVPVAEKTYIFKELYIETIIRNPKKVGLFGYRYSQHG